MVREKFFKVREFHFKSRKSEMLRVHILFFFPLNNKLMLGFKKIRVIGVNLGEILIKGKRNLFLAGNSSNLSLSHRGSTVTAKKIIRG